MSEATSMQIAGVQMDIKIMEPELNLENMEQAIRETTQRSRVDDFPSAA